MILVIGAGGMVGSALVLRIRDCVEEVGTVYSPWSGVPGNPSRWAIDVTSTEQLRRITRQSNPITKIYYCASRKKGPGTVVDQYLARVRGVQNVCRVFHGIPVIYCSSRHAQRMDSPYGKAQRVCEDVVTAAGGRFVRFPALYSSTYRSWLRWVKWIYPAWSVDQAVDALLEA